MNAKMNDPVIIVFPDSLSQGKHDTLVSCYDARPIVSDDPEPRYMIERIYSWVLPAHDPDTHTDPGTGLDVYYVRDDS